MGQTISRQIRDDPGERGYSRYNLSVSQGGGDNFKNRRIGGQKTSCRVKAFIRREVKRDLSNWGYDRSQRGPLARSKINQKVDRVSRRHNLRDSRAHTLYAYMDTKARNRSLAEGLFHSRKNGGLNSVPKIGPHNFSLCQPFLGRESRPDPS